MKIPNVKPANYLIFAFLVLGNISLIAQDKDFTCNLNIYTSNFESSNGLQKAKRNKAIFPAFKSLEVGQFPQISGAFNLKPKREDNQEYGAGPEAVVKSLILPGWGLSATSTNPGSKIFFVLTPLSYGLIIYGFNQKAQSNKLYKEYQESKDQKVMDDAIEKAYDKRQLYLNTVASGVAIYVFQAGATFIWGQYNNIYKERAEGWKQNVAINVVPYYDLSLRTCVINTNVSVKIGKTKTALHKTF